MLEATNKNLHLIQHAFHEMQREARAALKHEGFSRDEQQHERILAVRYLGQSFELEIPFSAEKSVADEFHLAHRARYGYAQQANTVEIVSARLRSTGLVNQAKMKKRQHQTRAGKIAKARRKAAVYFANGRAQAAVYARDELAPGARLETPCIVTEYSATTLIPHDAKAVIDNEGHLVIEL